MLFSTDGEDGWIYRVDLNTGEVLWQVYGYRGVTAEMILLESRLYGVALAEEQEVVLCLDAASGETIWSTPLPFSGEARLSLGRSPGIFGELLVHASADGAVHAFDLREGTEQWSIELGSTPTTAVVGSSATGLIYVGVEDGRLIQIGIDQEKQTREIQIDGRPASPRLLDGNRQLLIHRDWMERGGELLSFGPDLELQWSAAPPDTASWMTARLYPWRNHLVLGTNAGDFIAIDQATGDAHQLYHVSGVARSFAWHAGTAYFGTIDGALIAVEAIE